MNNLQIIGLSRGEILSKITRAYPEWRRSENRVRRLVGPRTKREVQLEQGAAIAYLASQYNNDGARILEIGACQGYTAGILALAAPLAQVTTLEPHAGRAANVRLAVGQLGVTVLQEKSTDYFNDAAGIRETYDLIFVDGDHAKIAHDLPFWNLLRPDGLFLHHDYSPLGSARECVPVYDALNHFVEHMSHPFDVLVQDDTLVGMAGWYKLSDETWPPDGATLARNGYVEETRVPAGQKTHGFSSAKGIICRHCLKTEDSGEHAPAFEVGDSYAEKTIDAPIDEEAAEAIAEGDNTISCTNTRPTNGEEENDD